MVIIVLVVCPVLVLVLGLVVLLVLNVLLVLVLYFVVVVVHDPLLVLFILLIFVCVWFLIVLLPVVFLVMFNLSSRSCVLQPKMNPLLQGIYHPPNSQRCF